MSFFTFCVLSSLVCLVGGTDKTKVYNARARRIQGANDMHIMVIQVGLTNFDESGQLITVPTPPIPVPDPIAHRVSWTKETGVVVRKNEIAEESREVEETIETRPKNSTLRVPEFITHYLSRAASTPDADAESRKFMATVLALTVGLIFLLLLAYAVSVLVHKRKKKQLMLRREQAEMEALRMKHRPKAKLPYEERLMLNRGMDDDYVFEHDYENLDEIDEQSDVEMLRRPPPVPPRINRPRPRLYMVLDQPVSILLDKEPRNVPIRSIPRRLRQDEDFAVYMQQHKARDEQERLRTGSL